MRTVDNRPELFTPPVKGIQTLTKDGRNGWDIYTYTGTTWRHKNAPNMTQAKLALESELKIIGF